MPNKKPNVVLVFADQWRAQAFGYAGDPNVQTPNLDALASRSVNCTHAVSGCSVCSPARASLLTGHADNFRFDRLMELCGKPEDAGSP